MLAAGHVLQVLGFTDGVFHVQMTDHMGMLMVCGGSTEEAARNLEELLTRVTFPIVRDLP